jgi:RNA polymerase sigma factor (sigma-70 family)
MQSTDDSALLRQYAENNSDEAFAALVTRHINLVYSVALRQTCNPHAAEEITQAVFIILARKAAQLRHDKALSSWLFQATRLTANNFIRGESRRHRREEEAYMQSVLNEAGTDVWPKIAPMLDNAVAGLCEKDRKAIVLRFYEGRNLREVGMALGASEDAAEKRVNRALEKLRKFFTKRGVTLSSVAITGAISANSVQAAPVGLTISTVSVVKGSAATVSILTLVKGTLKVMTWTKCKFALGIATTILLGGGAVTVGLSQIGGRPPVLSTTPIQQGPSVFVDSRFFVVSDELIKTLGITWQTKPGAATAVLAALQANEIIRQITNANTTVSLGRPRVNAGDGVKAGVSMSKPVTIAGTNAQVGISLDVTPSISGSAFDLDITGSWHELLMDGSQPNIRTTQADASVKLAQQQTIALRKEIEETGNTPSRSLIVFATPSLRTSRSSGTVTKGQMVTHTIQDGKAMTETNNFVAPKKP